MRRMAACLFAKPMTHAAQREYRFVVLNGGATEETVLLKISGMMRDALTQTQGGLIRPSPAPAETVGEDGALLPRPVKGSATERYRRATVKERKEEREETRLETRDSDGQVVSSDIKRRERVEEKVATTDLETDGRGIGDLRRAERREDAGSEHPVLELEQGSEERSDADGEDAVAKEIARDERDWNDERGRDEFVIPVVHRGSGRTYKSFEEMFDDPSAPMSPSTKTWEVSACNPQEIVRSYGAVATLAMKITRVAVEHRQEAAKRLLARPAMHQPYLRAAGRYRGQRVDRTGPFRCDSHQGLGGTESGGGESSSGRAAGMPTVSRVRSLKTWGIAKECWGSCSSRSVMTLKRLSPSGGLENHRTRGMRMKRRAICKPTTASGFATTTKMGRVLELLKLGWIASRWASVPGSVAVRIPR